jgi:hypothetical protein
LLQKPLSTEIIENEEKWKLVKEKIKEIKFSFEEVDKSRRGILSKESPSAEEAKILEMISDDPRGTDLNDIVMKSVEQKGEKFNLSELMTMIQDLFQKNHVILKILKRR